MSTNPWYDRDKLYAARSRAKGIDVRAELDDIEVGLDLLYAQLPTLIGDGTGFSAAIAVGAPTSSVHAITLSYLQSYVAATLIAGGAPGDIDITDLGVGSATAGQMLKVNAAGTAIIGAADSWSKKTAAYTLVAGDKVIVAPSSADLSITLPAALAVGDQFHIHNYGSDSYNVIIEVNGHTIKFQGSDIDSSGDGDLVLNNGDSVWLVADTTSSVEIV